MRYWRRGVVLVAVLLVGVCLAQAAGCAGGLPDWVNPINWFHDSAPALTDHKHAHDAADPTGLVALFGWLSRTVTILSVIFLIVGAFTRAYPIALPLLGILIGVGLGLAKGLIVEHPYWLYAAYAVGLAILVAPHVVAAHRGSIAKATGQPIVGSTGLELLARFNPFRSPTGSPVNGQSSRVRRSDRTAGMAVPAAKPGGSDGAGGVGERPVGI